MPEMHLWVPRLEEVLDLQPAPDLSAVWVLLISLLGVDALLIHIAGNSIAQLISRGPSHIETSVVSSTSLLGVSRTLRHSERSNIIVGDSTWMLGMG